MKIDPGYDMVVMLIKQGPSADVQDWETDTFGATGLRNAAGFGSETVTVQFVPMADRLRPSISFMLLYTVLNGALKYDEGSADDGPYAIGSLRISQSIGSPAKPPYELKAGVTSR